MLSDGHASDLGPATSTRLSGRPSATDDDDDDDYDLDANAVSDGFRPVPAPTHPPQTPTATATPAQPPPLWTPRDASHAARPSSTSKPPRPRDSLTLRNDGSSSAHRPPQHATSASTGSTPLIRPESPYRGPCGPSHPYPMYPQRTVSSATASTVPHLDRRSYDGPRDPTHPYALYTQNTAEPQIPVGFTGMGGAYQRQIGPDDEDAGDLIGPLGHLEELPPYTRYPQDPYAGRKSPEPANDAPPRPAQPIAGAGGLGIATRNPEFSSTEDDLGLLRSRAASRSDASQHEINTAARAVSEKSTLTKWQRRARKKVWGVVPYWAVCLLVLSVIVIGVVMGTVVGLLVAKRDASPSRGDKQLPNPAGVEPVKDLPKDLPPLVTGAFSLPRLDTSQASKSCFRDPTQAQAWSCDMPFRFYIQVGSVDGAPDTANYHLTLTPVNASSAKFAWGTQPPDIPDARRLTLVRDMFEEGRGPAWWLNLTHEKTVIVPEDKFPAQKDDKRDKLPGAANDDFAPGTGPRRFKKNVKAKEGDRPWICNWSARFDVFIYPHQNVSIPSQSASPSRAPAVSELVSRTADAASPTDGMRGRLPPLYPKEIKFLERRCDDDPRATARCRQVQITGDGLEKQDLVNADGRPIEVVIAKKGVPPGLEVSRRMRDRRSHPDLIVPREMLELTDCGCLWWST